MKINKSVVTFEDGHMGMVLTQDGEVFATLVSDFKPENDVDVNMFALMVGVIPGFTHKIGVGLPGPKPKEG